MKIISEKRIGIIGGTGRTGSQFARLFAEKGFTINVTGTETSDRNAEVLRTCDIVIFAVPLNNSAEIMERECEGAVRTDQLILDVSSLKERQVKAMLRSKGEVIGMHPLFGPWTDPRGQTIIVCPARCRSETVAALTELLEFLGMRVLRKTPQEHDRLMAVLQVLPHVKNLLVADVLRKLGADIAEIFETCTPAYELELNVVGRFLDDDPNLYGPIILDNPDTIPILEAFRSVLDECIAMSKAKDLQRFTERYKQLQEFFGPFAAEGRKTTEACIQLLSDISR